MNNKKTTIHTLIMLCIMLAANSTTFAQGVTTGSQGPSGGTGGSSCNTTGLGGRLISITVRSGTLIDALDLNYNNKATPSNIVCGGSGGSPQTISLIEGEYIFRVTGRYNRFVEYLRIQTNGTRQQTLIAGNTHTTATGYFNYQAIDGTMISNFIVKAGQYVDAIGVIIQKR